MLKINIMSIYLTITEQDVLNRPNDSDLGEFVRNRYWTEKKYENLRDYDDEKFIIIADETGLVKGIHLAKEVEVNESYVENGYDKCVVCGKVSPYESSTNINFRVGYVEGAGQGCFQPNKCDK